MSFDCQFFVEIRQHAVATPCDVLNGKQRVVHFMRQSQSCLLNPYSIWFVAAVLEDARGELAKEIKLRN